MDMGMVIAALGSLGSVGAATWRWMSAESRRNRALFDAPRIAIADYVDGALVRIVGRVRPGPTLTAPLSGRAAVLYEARIAPRLRPWAPVVHEADAVEFVVDDGTGHAQISAAGALFAFGTRIDVNDHAGPPEHAVLARHGKPRAGALRSSERIVALGDRIAVCGRATWQPDPDGVQRAGGYRDLPPGRLRFASTPASPLLLGDFDPGAR